MPAITTPLQTHLRTLPLTHVGLATPARAALWLRNASSIGPTPPLHLVHDLGALLTMPRPRLVIARPAHLPADVVTDPYLAFLHALAAHPLLRTLPTWRLSDAVVGVILARLVAGVTFPASYAWPTGAGGLALAQDLAKQLANTDPAHLWRTTPPAARPSLTELLPPAALAQIQASARTLDEAELRYLHQYGPRLPGAPDPRTLLDLFHLLNLPPHLRLTLTQVLQLTPRLSQASQPDSAQTYALGGYAGLTHKGSLDSLLPTELAYSDALFYHRLLNQEALYYGREAEQERGQAVAYLVTQAGLELKGDPALLAQAATLALAQSMQQRGYTVYQSFVGSRWTPPSDLSQPAAIHQVLAYQDDGWLDPAAMLTAIQRQLTAWRSPYRTRQLLWIVGYHWDADTWRQHLPLYRALSQEATAAVWFIRGQPTGANPSKSLPSVARHLGRAQLLDTTLLWAKHTPPKLAPLPPPPPPRPQPAWQQWRDEIERGGFQDGTHDVLHFRDEDRQLAAWQKLAVLDNEPHQAAIDEYLRTLAPANMVYIPAGRFMMGSSDTSDDKAIRDTRRIFPQQIVWLGGYYIGRYPITNIEFAEFIRANGYLIQQYWTLAGWEYIQINQKRAPAYWDNGRFNRPQQPVVTVSWYEAVAYCAWHGGRLPTEAEWEKAAGWDPLTEHKRRYPWGDVWKPDHCNIDKVAGDQTTPVDAYAPQGDSAYGCSDMAGNVWEWCNTRWGTDLHVPDYRYPYRADDGREERSGDNEMLRILRGGSFVSSDTEATCAYRDWMDPEGTLRGRGFRMVAPRCLLVAPA